MNVILDNRFRENVKRLMADQHVSQVELARRLDVTPSTVNQYLSGHRVPGLGTVERFASALHVDNVLDLLAESEKTLAIA